MRQYKELITNLLENGTQSTDRTGVGTLRKAGHTMRFDLQQGLPVVTTKKIHMKSVIHELLWVLSGDTNIKYLVDNGVSIWTDWPLQNYNYFCAANDLPEASKAVFEHLIRADEQFAEEWGTLGPVYGHQFRNFGGQPYGVYSSGIDQIQNALDLLRTKPDDRGIIVNAWNPADLPLMALRPCHCMFQLLVIDGKLNLILTQRSCDSFLGAPFNIAFYALITHMFAQQTDLDVGELIWNGGDVHLYLNHLEQAELLLSRPPRALPKLELRKAASMFDYKFEDFSIVGYNPWPAIPAPVAV